MSKKYVSDPWARMRTRNDLAADEVISSLQKSIRRGKKEKHVNLHMKCILHLLKWKKNYGEDY